MVAAVILHASHSTAGPEDEQDVRRRQRLYLQSKAEDPGGAVRLEDGGSNLQCVFDGYGYINLIFGMLLQAHSRDIRVQYKCIGGNQGS